MDMSQKGSCTLFCLLVIISMLMLSSCLRGTHAAGQWTGQTLNSNGIKIRYYVHGEGEPVMLIHGWVSSARINWILPGGTADLLAKDHQVIALDMRGHGESDKPTNEDAYGPELVQDIVQLLNHLQIKKATDLTVPNYRKFYSIPLLPSGTIALQVATETGFSVSILLRFLIPTATEFLLILTECTHKSPHSNCNRNSVPLSEAARPSPVCSRQQILRLTQANF
jgi:hypothetical protein